MVLRMRRSQRRRGERERAKTRENGLNRLPCSLLIYFYSDVSLDGDNLSLFLARVAENARFNGGSHGRFENVAGASEEYCMHRT